MSECLICGPWQDSEPRCECYEEMLSLRAKLTKAEAEAERLRKSKHTLAMLEDSWAENDRLRGRIKELIKEITMRSGDLEQALAKVDELQAEVARLTKQLGAHRRLILGDYVGFQNGGGPNECAHGIAAGIACRTCDMETFNSCRKALLGEGGK